MRTKLKSLMASAMVSVFATAAFAQEGANLLLPPATYPTGQAAQQQQVGSVPMAAAAAPTAQEVNDKAFKAAVETIFPLTPDQQRTFKQKGDENDRAVGEPLHAISPVSRSVRVSLRSGDAPPTIKTSPGWISTITFADVTGQPWPVLSVTNGNPDAYDVKNSGAEGTSNIVTISSKQAYVPSNIAVTLLGAKVPVMMTLQPSNGAVDFRVDAQIDQRGPNASYDVISSDSLPATSDSLMLGFLDGVPPTEASKLKTSDPNTQAWRYNDLLYIRTTKSLLSPAYLSKQSNVVGVNVYVLNEAPVMVMSGSGNGPDAGRLESVTINR
ncbi:DotH/IcmK family type IV secretion protein [Rhizobium sp. BK176]|uniref:DotH/IcmK family type IV secretion protein n=1 Tax=Rhizobium sp. BK176 TaxID=2587071 RepID=UPI0021681905|nr:DotH/IcmK family type IV secretion protein [Rhizobium sp. BK176]MCS4089500.1 intracellular multiplication protein IcmK [Rhizobium sp. BK176]